MSNPYHHALSSARKFGGEWLDYVAIHEWFDGSKAVMCDCRHRALRHHAEGIATAITLFGTVIKNSAGQMVPVRLIGEQHVREDLGRIPTAEEWLREIPLRPWMNKPERLSKDAQLHVQNHAAA